MDANAEYKKETVIVMMTVLGIWNAEQEIAMTKVFQLVPTAALILFQVRHSKNLMCYENEIIVFKHLSKDITRLYYIKRKF
jgi:hypothetical protein